MRTTSLNIEIHIYPSGVGLRPLTLESHRENESLSLSLSIYLSISKVSHSLSR